MEVRPPALQPTIRRHTFIPTRASFYRFQLRDFRQLAPASQLQPHGSDAVPLRPRELGKHVSVEEFHFPPTLRRDRSVAAAIHHRRQLPISRSTSSDPSRAPRPQQRKRRFGLPLCNRRQLHHPRIRSACSATRMFVLLPFGLDINHSPESHVTYSSLRRRNSQPDAAWLIAGCNNDHVTCIGASGSIVLSWSC